MENIKKTLLSKLKEEQLRENFSMREICSFKAGGECKILISPSCEEELSFVVESLKLQSCKFFVMGRGSNLLVKDAGYDGAIIWLSKDFARSKLEKNTIEAMSGISLKNLAILALENSLTGLEFAHGIPGSLGGALFMNAGAYDGEMRQVVTSVKAFDCIQNKILELDNDDMDFSYRTSLLQKNKNLIAISAKITLEQGDKAEILGKMQSLDATRAEKQPLDLPSAGSTFRRPPGYFAGQLISESGLKGKRIGGAMVSNKHAGFIVNTGGATANDISDLIEFCTLTVQEKFAVLLETELIII